MRLNDDFFDDLMAKLGDLETSPGGMGPVYALGWTAAVKSCAREVSHFFGRKYDDPVDHPAHYTSGKIEVIDFLEDQKLPFHLANALKYICRAGKKSPETEVEDLQKAMWYLQRYIKLRRYEQ